VTAFKIAGGLFSIFSSITAIAATVYMVSRVFSAPHAAVEIIDLFALFVVVVHLSRREARE